MHFCFVHSLLCLYVTISQICSSLLSSVVSDIYSSYADTPSVILFLKTELFRVNYAHLNVIPVSRHISALKNKCSLFMTSTQGTILCLQCTMYSIDPKTLQYLPKMNIKLSGSTNKPNCFKKR